MKKPRLPKAPKILKKPPFRRRRAPEERAHDALQNVPRITNETVAEHREEVLGSARKYIYPLQHSKHHVVSVSLWLFGIALLVFLVTCGLALYKFQSTSSFMYGVTRVIPFPVAKTGSSWVSYESYLFELRHYMHYYETQQKINFNDKSGKQQLANFKQRSLQQVIDAAVVKQLAAKNHITVSDGEVNDQVALVKRENRLGSSDQVFKDVLNEFWGWSADDFKRELRQQLLTQKVVTDLDTGTQERAKTALAQLKNGTDFGTVAGQVSEDAGTKGNGGQYPRLIDSSDRDIAPQVAAELFKLQPGQTSDIINTGYTLEIVKLLDKQGSKVHAAHISFGFQDPNTYIKPLEAKQKPHRYIKV